MRAESDDVVLGPEDEAHTLRILYVDVDLVATRDGHLVARHELNLIETTNVRELPQFAGGKSTAAIDGVEQEGY